MARAKAAKVSKSPSFPLCQRGMKGGFLSFFARLASLRNAQDMLGARNFLEVVLSNILNGRIYEVSNDAAGQQRKF